MYRTDVLGRIREQRILHEASLELTYRCNLDCFYCYNDREKAGQPLTLDQYKKVLTDLADMQTMFLMLTGGEPMIHPHFFDIGHIARELGFVLRIRTNGHSLSQQNCERLLKEVDPYMVDVSLHGATAEVHDRQTRVQGSFERLLRNIKTATTLGLRVGVISTPTSWNEHQIEDMLELCDELSVSLTFQGPVGPRDNGDTAPLSIQPAPETWEHITRILKDKNAAQSLQECQSETGSQTTKPAQDTASCGVGTMGVDIDPYGNVQACMHLQESAGNLHDHSIKEIWNNSPLFKRARARALDAGARFQGKPFEQYGAPVYCLAVEENANKGCGECQNCG